MASVSTNLLQALYMAMRMTLQLQVPCAMRLLRHVLALVFHGWLWVISTWSRMNFPTCGLVAFISLMMTLEVGYLS